MRRLFLIEVKEDSGGEEELMRVKSWTQFGGTMLQGGKVAKVHNQSLVRCSECGSDVKVLVSRRRNPHSNKLGRAVTMKNHDLCRRCWRRLIQKPRQVKFVLIGGKNHVSRGRDYKRVEPFEPNQFPKTGTGPC